MKLFVNIYYHIKNNLTLLEYLIPGTAAPNGSCHFTYRSESKKRGDFNSPRHPANYPNGLNCTFLFLATPNEQVTVIFDQFKVGGDKVNNSVVQFGYDNILTITRKKNCYFNMTT